MTEGIDLSFIKDPSQLSEIERDLYEVAQVDGDMILEKSDFDSGEFDFYKSDAHRNIRSTGSRSTIKMFEAKYLFQEGIINRSFPDLSPELKNELRVNIESHAVDATLLTFQAKVDKLKELYEAEHVRATNYENFIPTARVITILMDAQSMDDWLYCDRDRFISETFSADMEMVMDALISGQMTCRIRKKDTSEESFMSGAAAAYAPETEEGGKEIRLYQQTEDNSFDDELNNYLVHECVHAAQDLKGVFEGASEMDLEKEAYAVEAMYSETVKCYYEQVRGTDYRTSRTEYYEQKRAAQARALDQMEISSNEISTSRPTSLEQVVYNNAILHDYIQHTLYKMQYDTNFTEFMEEYGEVLIHDRDVPEELGFFAEDFEANLCYLDRSNLALNEAETAFQSCKDPFTIKICTLLADLYNNRDGVSKADLINLVKTQISAGDTGDTGDTGAMIIDLVEDFVNSRPEDSSYITETETMSFLIGRMQDTYDATLELEGVQGSYYVQLRMQSILLKAYQAGIDGGLDAAIQIIDGEFMDYVRKEVYSDDEMPA